MSVVSPVARCWPHPPPRRATGFPHQGEPSPCGDTSRNTSSPAAGNGMTGAGSARSPSATHSMTASTSSDVGRAHHRRAAGRRRHPGRACDGELTATCPPAIWTKDISCGRCGRKDWHLRGGPWRCSEWGRAMTMADVPAAHRQGSVPLSRPERRRGSAGGDATASMNGVVPLKGVDRGA
jgi:hypothetical protein